MPVAIPYTFTGGVGHKAKASEVNADFQALAAKFSEGAGGIVDADISTSADLNANKLSATAGKRITAPKFEPGAVDSVALKSDVAIDANRAVTKDHVRDGAISTAKLDHTGGTEAVDTGAIRNEAVNKFKLSATPGLKATYTQLECLVETTGADFDLNVGPTAGDAVWSLWSSLTQSAGNWVVTVAGTSYTSASGGAANSITVSPPTARAAASFHVWYELKDVVKSVSGGQIHLKGRVVFFSIALS